MPNKDGEIGLLDLYPFLEQERRPGESLEQAAQRFFRLSPETRANIELRWRYDEVAQQLAQEDFGGPDPGEDFFIGHPLGLGDLLRFLFFQTDSFLLSCMALCFWLFVLCLIDLFVLEPHGIYLLPTKQELGLP